MPAGIIRKLTPEEEELHRKREELAAVRATLAERELELADLLAELKAFEGLYLRQVGVLYAELDEWEAKIAELEAKLNPSETATKQAHEARTRAEETREAAHGEAAKAHDFKPSPELKRLFREVAKHIHPDFAKDEADKERRTRLMAEANESYSRGDAEGLQNILGSYDSSSEAVPGEGIGAQLIRIIRQIHQARKNIAGIEVEVAALRQSETAQLKQDVETSRQNGSDTLAELAAGIRKRIAHAQNKHQGLVLGMKEHGR